MGMELRAHSDGCLPGSPGRRGSAASRCGEGHAGLDLNPLMRGMSCTTLSQQMKLPKPQFPHLWNGENMLLT